MDDPCHSQPHPPALDVKQQPHDRAGRPGAAAELPTALQTVKTGMDEDAAHPLETPADAREGRESSSSERPDRTSKHETFSPAAVTFITTEHFALEGARSATIAESNGRANILLGSVSGGLIALGFIGQASHLGTAFYAFGLILLPTLAFLGLTTFHRVFQSGLEDVRYAHRIAELRAFYFDAAPEVERYLLSVPPHKRLEVQGIWASSTQKFLGMAGTVAVITSVLVGSAVGLASAVMSNHSPWAAFPAGALAAATTLALFIRFLDRHIAAARRDMRLDEG
jgi:hypothetical protein